MTYIDDFYNYFSEFDRDKTLNTLEVLFLIYPSYYKQDYEKASRQEKIIILFLLAHLLSLRLQELEGAKETGAVVNKNLASVSVDGVSESYIANNLDMDGYNSFFTKTPYGQYFLLMTRNKFGGVWL